MSPEAPAPQSGRLAPSSEVRRLTRLVLERQEVVIGLVGVLLLVFFTIESQYFFTGANAQTMAAYIAPIAFFAIAEVLILILGEIDLSVGEVYVLSPFIVMHLNNIGVPVPAGVIGSLVICGFIGAVNGLITVKLHVPSFITTLGMTFALEGIILIGSNGAPAVPVGTGWLPDFMGLWTWSEAIWALVIVVLMHVMLRRTTFGLHTIATGGNLQSARESGIKVDFIKIWCFVLCSLLGGLMGILDGWHIGAIDPATDGLSFMFYGVSAAVLGGTALTGGRGTMIGACIGAMVLGILEDGFHIMGVNSFAYDLVLGVAILAAMILNIQLERAGLRRRGSFARAVNVMFARRKGPVRG
jgi:simple sugar transport system permease protein